MDTKPFRPWKPTAEHPELAFVDGTPPTRTPVQAAHGMKLRGNIVRLSRPDGTFPEYMAWTDPLFVDVDNPHNMWPANETPPTDCYLKVGLVSFTQWWAWKLTGKQPSETYHFARLVWTDQA